MLEVLKKLKNKGVFFEKKKEIPFSVLSFLHNEISRKESAHSKILQNLLSPKNQHGFKDALIDSFLKEIGIKNFKIDEISNLDISTEFGTEGRFIDILISWEADTERKAVIIENKLNYAVDQKNQLNDYYSSIKKMHHVEKVVYMHINPHKSVKDTDATKEVLNKTIDFSIVNLIEWLDKCIGELANHEQIYHLIVYRDLLKIMLTNHYNIMKAEEIQKKLSSEEIKELIELTSIVSSDDWHNAKYLFIKEKVSEHIPIKPILNLKGRNAELFYKPYQYWVELWSYDKRIDLYLCSYNEYASIKLSNADFSPSSYGKGRYYYKSQEKSSFSFDYPDGLDSLIEFLKSLLTELSKYKEE